MPNLKFGLHSLPMANVTKQICNSMEIQESDHKNHIAFDFVVSTGN